MKLRFAPSPTGLLHVGNARVALVNWLLARRGGGTVLLRLDDTDTERSRAEYAAALEEDLRWLGLDWDESFRQSDRRARYAAAAERRRVGGRRARAAGGEAAEPVRPGADPRRRHAALHLHLRSGRPGKRRHAHRPRRG